MPQVPHADAVTRRLQDTYTNVRQAALDALGEAFLQGEAFLGGQAAEQVMAVGRRLADSDWRVRVAALQLLGRLGAGARQHTTAVGGCTTTTGGSGGRHPKPPFGLACGQGGGSRWAAYWGSPIWAAAAWIVFGLGGQVSGSKR